MSSTITLPDFYSSGVNSSFYWLTDMLSLKPKTSSTTVHYKPEISRHAKLSILKIESFKILENNWDSFGAESPSQNAIKNAKDFIRAVDKLGMIIYFTAPGRNGDVLVELKFSSQISVEVYFNKDNIDELLIFKENECIFEGPLKENFNQLLKHFNESKSNFN
ncbi:MAG: hypothetical protein RO257_07630 [Candidatus Kapabacteria bacterium]|nr:hypothetical protein [Candidatus Kapabacteria bacterium]